MSNSEEVVEAATENGIGGEGEVALKQEEPSKDEEAVAVEQAAVAEAVCAKDESSSPSKKADIVDSAGVVKNGAVKTEAIEGGGADETKQQGFVLVAASAATDAEKLELPYDADGSLRLAALTQAFADARGLKYPNPATGAFRMILLDDQGQKLCPPPDGWGDRCYLITVAKPVAQLQPQQAVVVAPAPLIEASAKRPAESPPPPPTDHGGLTKRRRLSPTPERAPPPPPPPPPSTERICSDLVVLNLSFKTTEQTLRDFFETFGKVIACEVKTDYRTGTPKGFGFVQFCDYDVQTKVLDIYEHTIDGRTCQVKVPNRRETVAQPVSGSKMYVGRIPHSMNEDEITEFFTGEAAKLKPGAKVESVIMPKPHRGFCFVNFNDSEVTRRIIHNRDYIIRGVSVCVSSASPRDQQQHQHAGGGGGGGRRGAPPHMAPPLDYAYDYAPPPPPRYRHYPDPYYGEPRAPPRYAPSPYESRPSYAADPYASGYSGYYRSAADPYARRPSVGGRETSLNTHYAPQPPPSQSGAPTQPPPSSASPGANTDSNLHAAWQAFWNTLQTGGAGSQQSPAAAALQLGYGSAYTSG